MFVFTKLEQEKLDGKRGIGNYVIFFLRAVARALGEVLVEHTTANTRTVRLNRLIAQLEEDMSSHEATLDDALFLMFQTFLVIGELLGVAISAVKRSSTSDCSLDVLGHTLSEASVLAAAGNTWFSVEDLAVD